MAIDPEGVAAMVAAAMHVSRLLDIPSDDAVALVDRYCAAINKEVAARKARH